MKKIWKALLMLAAILGISFTPSIATLAAENVLDVSCAPTGMVEMADGSFLITDVYNKVVWNVRDGKSLIYAGSSGAKGLYGEPAGGYRDDVLSQSLFAKPWAVVPFKEGYAVSDSANNVIRLLSGNQVRTINLNIALSNPSGLAVDGDGSLYIADTNNNVIRKVTVDGSVSTWLSGLSEPTGLFYKNGSLYIADSGNNRILKAESGTITEIIGGGSSGFADGDMHQALFANPMGITVEDDGTIYVADTGNSAIRKIQGSTVSTLTSNKGTESENASVSPVSLLIKGDRIYVCDMFSRMVFEISKEQGVNE